MRLLALVLLFASFSAFSEITINKIAEIKKGKQTKLIINFEGEYTNNPEINFDNLKNKKISFHLPNANLSNSLQKHLSSKKLVSVSEKDEKVNIIVDLNQYYKGISNQVSLSVLSDKIIASFPTPKKLVVTTKKKEVITPKVHPVVVKKETKIPKKVEFTPIMGEVSKKRENLDYLVNDFITNEKESKKVETVKDTVKTKLGSQKKKSFLAEENSSMKKSTEMNYSTYAVKVVAVLAGIILLFTVSVNFFRKKVLNKNKLGFLNNSKIVEVIATTYVGPKKNLILVKVHEQFLLLSNTENNINFLTEVRDIGGLLRKGEEEVTGTNFQSSLVLSETEELENMVKLKDANKIHESQPVSYKSATFSDHLKKRVKRLKPLQNQS